jgi:indole-3-acetate monooxygenase
VLVPTPFGASYTALDPLPGPAPVGRLAPITLYGVGVAAVALGIASAALQALVDLAAVKTPHLGMGRLGERPAAQASVGRSQVARSGGRAYLYDCIDAAWTEACEGHVTNPTRMILRGAIVHAIESATSVVDAVHVAAGTSAIVAGLPFERRFRDMHAVTQHPQAAASHFEAVGRSRLGDIDAIETL